MPSSLISTRSCPWRRLTGWCRIGWSLSTVGQALQGGGSQPLVKAKMTSEHGLNFPGTARLCCYGITRPGKSNVTPTRKSERRAVGVSTMVPTGIRASARNAGRDPGAACFRYTPSMARRYATVVLGAGVRIMWGLASQLRYQVDYLRRKEESSGSESDSVHLVGGGMASTGIIDIPGQRRCRCRSSCRRALLWATLQLRR